MAHPSERPTPSRDFFLRRLHSLTGIIPIGAFLIFHLSVNYMVTANTATQDYYQKQVESIHGLGPFLLPLELVFILLPIAFHAALGVKIWLEGEPNTRYYRYGGSFRYALQRWTGLIALAFIAVHLWQLHWVGKYLPGGNQFDPEHATATTAWVLQASGWVRWAYAVGIIAVCYHFANGIWTFLITWGVTIGDRAQLKSGYICAAVGLVLAVLGLGALNAFVQYPDAAPKPAVQATRSPGPAAAEAWESPAPAMAGTGLAAEPPGREKGGS